MPLTDLTVKGAKPQPGKTLKLTDGGGLQLWVAPSGGKLWRLAYRFDGKQKKASFGAWPAVSLKEARRLRDEAKALLASGIDPGQQKKVEKANTAVSRANTFSAV